MRWCGKSKHELARIDSSGRGNFPVNDALDALDRDCTTVHTTRSTHIRTTRVHKYFINCALTSLYEFERPFCMVACRSMGALIEFGRVLSIVSHRMVCAGEEWDLRGQGTPIWTQSPTPVLLTAHAPKHCTFFTPLH